MKFGIVRHFKVKHPRPKSFFLSFYHVKRWFNSYNQSTDLKYIKNHINQTHWDIIYVSSMVRSIETAKHFGFQHYVIREELNELELWDELSFKGPMPFVFWTIYMGIAASKENKSTKQFRERIETFVEELLTRKEQRVLLIAHHFVIKEIVRILRKKGYKGENYPTRSYGKLYIYTT